MKSDQIQAGSAYVNKSGRSERAVLAVGTHIKPEWLGDEKTEPQGEPGVVYIQTRLGNTYYGSQPPRIVYLSAFASWASRKLTESQRVPEPKWHHDEVVGGIIES